jgi:hypothetical protein
MENPAYRRGDSPGGRGAMTKEIAILLLMALGCAIAAWAAWQWTRSIVAAVLGGAALVALFFAIAPELGTLTVVALVALVAGFLHGGPRKSGRTRRIAGYALLALGFAAPVTETVYVNASFGAVCDRLNGTRILQPVTNVTAFADERGDGSYICHYCAAPLYRHVDVLVTDRWLNYSRSALKAEALGYYRLVGGKQGDAECAVTEMPYWGGESLKGRCLVPTKIERSDAPYRIRVELLEHKTSAGLVKERREVYATAEGRTVATYGSVERPVDQFWFEKLEMAFNDLWYGISGLGTYDRWSTSCRSARGQPQLMIDKIFPPAK